MFTRKRLFAVGAGVLVLLALVAGTALAQTPTPDEQATNGRTNYGQLFLDKLASTLGITREQLSSAIKQAGTETVDQAVQQGDLAPNTADRIKQRIQDGEQWLGFPRLHRQPPLAQRVRPFALDAAGEAVAKALGMTQEELRTALRDGKSIADLASEKGITAEQIKTAVVDATKARLDQAVAAGNLTQAQADRILQTVKDMPAESFLQEWCRPAWPLRPNRPAGTGV
ncbi:MAG: hypothetical protein M0Z94_10470 [Dehalococcoidales bacterium]|nr:hypothetical protein [Dehalococcoidales bacterium]